MGCWALKAVRRRSALACTVAPLGGQHAGLLLTLLTALWVSGCSQQRRESQQVDPTGWAAPTVLVVAPVINLSDSSEWDPVKVTDIVAQEFSARPNTTVVPVNLVLASLARRGKTSVRSPADAVALATEFGADATVVTAVTAFQPYDPPLMGLVMQWYAAIPPAPEEGSGPAEHKHGAEPDRTAAAAARSLPRFQVQRVFNAADHETRADIKRFAGRRDGLQSPYEWQVVLKSQELFVRYCSWASVRSITRAADLAGALNTRPAEIGD